MLVKVEPNRVPYYAPLRLRSVLSYFFNKQLFNLPLSCLMEKATVNITFLVKPKKKLLTATETFPLLRWVYAEGGRVTYSTVTKLLQGLLRGLEGFCGVVCSFEGDTT